MSLTVAAVVYNEAAKITEFLQHAATFSDELLVIDQSSDDGTADLAREQGAVVVNDTHWGWPEPSRELIEPRVITSHVLLLDADERIEDGQTHVFRALEPDFDAAWLPRRTFVDGVHVLPQSLDEQMRWWKVGMIEPFSHNLHSYIRPVRSARVAWVSAWVIFHPKTLDEQLESLNRYEQLAKLGVGVG